MPRKTRSKALAMQQRKLSFNEAAARCRGKPCPSPAFELRLRASMRPRPDAAENPRPGAPVVGGAGPLQ